jgi:hypothetical protein
MKMYRLTGFNNGTKTVASGTTHESCKCVVACDVHKYNYAAIKFVAELLSLQSVIYPKRAGGLDKTSHGAAGRLLHVHTHTHTHTFTHLVVMAFCINLFGVFAIATIMC